MIRNDSGGFDAVLSPILTQSPSNNNNKDKNTECSKIEEQFQEHLEKLTQIGNTSSDESIVSTTSTDAILRDSDDDDLDTSK